MKEVAFSELIGKTLVKIERIGGYDGEQIDFICEDGSIYRMGHHQDCCESVFVEDVCGELDDLIGRPILLAEEVSNHKTGEWDEAMEWTFYKLATNKGYATIRWYGESNGYYSTSVSFEKVQ
jgi:hypothetical protein